MQENDLINTKSKKKVRYEFIKPTPRTDYLPKEDLTDIIYFYQICIFPNPKTNKFEMRKYILNGKNDVLDVKKYLLNKDQCKKFFEVKNSNEYKSYPQYYIDEVDGPTMADIFTARSAILTKNYDYTGYAPF